MGKVDVGEWGFFQSSTNTKLELARDVTPDGVRRVLEKLSQSQSLRDGRVCYVFGMGARTRDTYTALKRQRGLRVLFRRSILPSFLKFLQFFIASHEGLIKIEDLSILPNVFLTLMDQSAVGVYCVSAGLESELVRLAIENRSPRQHDLGVKADSSYAYYIVDAENAESTTGMIEIISYGIDTPTDMIPYS